MMSTKVEYENLKKEIIKELPDTFDLEKVKLYFASEINSRRSLSKVKSLDDVFVLLERRDIIHCDEVTALHYLGEKLKNAKIIDLVKGYEKLYLELEPCLCGGYYPFEPVVPNGQVINSETCLQQAITNIAENIGQKWHTLISELNLPLCYVDEIREKYPSDFSQQALAALLMWQKYYDNSASLEVLMRALEARLCKRHGIGLHLLKPIIKVE